MQNQFGAMEMRQSEMMLIDEEFGDELAELKTGEIGGGGGGTSSALPRSAQQASSVNSAVFSSPGSVRTNVNSRHRNDLKLIERERKENYEVRTN